MTQQVKQKFNFEEFLETFLTAGKKDENIAPNPFEVGISISQNALATIQKSIQKSLNTTTINKGAVSRIK
jgi:hypothetical protein